MKISRYLCVYLCIGEVEDEAMAFEGFSFSVIRDQFELYHVRKVFYMYYFS